jgi:hypothetical protein
MKDVLVKALALILIAFPLIAHSQVTDKDVGRINVVQTAVPFLRIIPDARSGGMGDVGMTITPDANAAYFNAAKLPFAYKPLGVSISYTPWLRNLGITDIFMTHLAAYYQIGSMQAVHTSLKFFSLGNITFTDETSAVIGDYSPRELAFDAGYSRKLGQNFGLGVALRYIYSNLAAGQEVSGIPVKAGHAVGTDITTYYEKEIAMKKMRSEIAWGLALTNIGSKISYTDDALNKDFIPTNMGLGIGYRLFPNDFNEISFYFDVNKLLVPTPDTIDANGNGIWDYKEKSSIAGMFSSFADAPGGFKEEIKEFNWAMGVEYWYDEQFAIRAGYFSENSTKGNRKYFTAGVGVKYSVFGLNFSYLVPTSKQRNPLDNTFRFSLLFEFDKKNRGDGSETRLNNFQQN